MTWLGTITVFVAIAGFFYVLYRVLEYENRRERRELEEILDRVRQVSRGLEQARRNAERASPPVETQPPPPKQLSWWDLFR